jgi:iron complex outermembrane receptor protein
MNNTSPRINTTFLRTVYCLGLLAATNPSLVAAQNQQQARVIEEVYVTAQKRQQSLMEVGISVAVAGEKEIRDRRISMVTDITLFTPNASIKENIPGLMPIITVRGVGLNDFNAANNPATGVYIDGVSLSSLALLSSDFFDLERIEVLKGPQGTLYGRNSTAGALNITTAKPDLENFGARVSVGAGSYDAIELEGMLNVPLSDSLGLRLAAKGIDQGEGYWDNDATGDDIGQRDVQMARAQLLWRPSERTDILLKLENQRGRSELGSPEFFGVLPTANTSNCPGRPECSNFLGYSDTDGDPFKGSWSVSPDYDLDQSIITAKIDVDLDFATLTSVTGYIDFDRKYESDVDASPMRILDFVNTDAVEQFSQELRLAGDTDALIWQVVAFYATDKVKTTYAGQLQALLNTTTYSPADVEAESQAIFANAEWLVSDSLTLIAGLRATQENKSNRGFTSDLVSEVPGSGLSGAPFGSPPIVLASVDDDIDDNSVDWKLGLNWQLEESTLVYLSASQGTKSGGFFTGVATTVEQLLPYDAETLTAYELGIKGRASDYGMSYEASVFYYDYEDVQTYISDTTGPVPVNRLSNIKGATIYGLDLMAQWKPVMLEALTLSAGIGILDTELEAFDGPNGTVSKGNEQPDAPDLTANLSASYDFNLTESLPAQFAVDGRYQSDAFHDALNNPLLESGSYWVVNARLSAYLDDQWEFTAWGKNLADEEYVVQGSDQTSLGNGFRVYGPPRTYGVTITRHFD